MLDSLFQAAITISYFIVPLGLIIILISGNTGKYKSVGIAIHFSFVAIRRGIRDYSGVDDVSMWSIIHGTTIIIASLFILYDIFAIRRYRV